MKDSLVTIVSVLQDEKSLRAEGWQQLHNNVNVLNATEVHILGGLKLDNSCYTCLATIKKTTKKTS